MNALVKNEDTGFLESQSHNLETPKRTAFNSPRKLAFLDLANQYANQEQAPNLTKICDQVGIGLQTFYDHLEIDGEFKRCWEEVLLKIEDALQRSLIRQGVKGSQGVTAAIFWLKNRFNKRWNDGQQQISLDIGQLKSVLGRTDEFIDAELVKPKQLSTVKQELPSELPPIDK